MPQHSVDLLPNELRQDVYRFVEEWMGRLERFRRPPAIVYHYCDANALLSIFKTRRLWASGHRYLNDRFELTSLFRLLPQYSAAIDHPAADLLGELAMVGHTEGTRMLASAMGMEYYCTCFSSNGDLLSQWRAYGDDGRGYALGFQTSALKEHANRFHKMLYGPSELMSCLTELFVGLGEIIKDHIGLFNSSEDDYAPGGQTARIWLSVRLGECLAELAPYSKHDSFKEEDEWRLYANGEKTEFRASQGKIVPYKTVDMSASENDQRLALSEIVVGPKNDQLDAERSLTYLASEFGYGHAGIKIVKSKSTYR